ncbi:MAG: phospholipid carrier-dependent glycosyltransferase [Betaproteobacteria bacterium]|nr:phospholipid carrier-dependent glycosyltransferase [Betaproteobacteria bacterium]
MIELFGKRPTRLLSASDLWALLAWLILAAGYYVWTWSPVLANFGGDNAVYLMTAESYSPYFSHGPVAQFFASHSQYPPLFPFMLAILGGGKSLLVSHLITTTFLVAALPVFYVLLKTQELGKWKSLALVALFALLPGTYMEALDILSENLYLLFTLTALLCVSLADTTSSRGWLWAAAVSIAAACLTRSAGVALAVAFGLYLWASKTPRKTALFGAAILPMFAWQAVGQGSGRANYYRSLVQTFSHHPLQALQNQMSVEMHALGYGWLANFIDARYAIWAIALIGLLCLAGTLHRLIQKKIDGFYIALYLALILIWPFPDEATRFAFVIVPILLMQGTLLATNLARAASAKTPLAGLLPAVVLLVPALLVAPTVGLTIQRFQTPLPPNLEPYKHTPGWYAADPREAVDHIQFNAGFEGSFMAVKQAVPAHACIFSIKPSIVSYLSGRMSVSPPVGSTNAGEFSTGLRKAGCRYVYFAPFASPTFPQPFYPAARLGNTVKVVADYQIGHEKNGMIGLVGVLGELTR